MKLSGTCFVLSFRRSTTLATGRPYAAFSSTNTVIKYHASSRYFQERYASKRMSSSDTIDSEVYPHNLIDVDCNLLHADLTSLLSSSASAKSTQSSHLRILSHPSTRFSNIQAVFSPSSTIDEAERIHSILQESSLDAFNDVQVKMSIGVHPYHTRVEDVGEFSNVNLKVSERVQSLLNTDRDHKWISCVGEMGLDYSEGFPDRELQLPWFKYQLNLAKEYNLPMFIHERLAFKDTIQLIDEVFPGGVNESPPIIIHCFTGGREECQEYVSRGYHISVSGFILKSGEGPEEVCSCLREGIIPLEKLMVETDAPYMGFSTCRESYFTVEKQINEEFQSLKSKKKKSLIKSTYPNVPSALPKVFEHAYKCLSEGRNERGEEELSIADTARIIYTNSANFFGFHDN